jgi:tripartite-type tricarboxylate transporter receptor subunit TctC
MLKSTLAAVAALCLLAGPVLAQAQADYPTKPVKIIVPAAAGGGTDTTARMIADHLSRTMGQNFIVENRGGGGALIGTEAAARSPADGYTLLMTPSTLTTMHIVRKAMPIDAVRDFTPITQFIVLPQVLVVHPSVPANTLAEFIALAKKEPGKLSYGSAGPGTAPHMAMELLKSNAQADINHIPYRGVAPALQDILGGRVSGMIVNVLIAKPHIDAGKLRALGVTSLQRSRSLPNVPTIAESGLPNYRALQWFGMVAPAGTPQPIVERLQKEIAAVLNTPAMQKRLEIEGADPVGNTAAEFGKVIKDEIAMWEGVAKAADIKPQ